MHCLKEKKVSRYCLNAGHWICSYRWDLDLFQRAGDFFSIFLDKTNRASGHRPRTPSGSAPRPCWSPSSSPAPCPPCPPNPLTALYLHSAHTSTSKKAREREQQSMQAGLVWQPHSVLTLSTPSCYKSIPALYFQMKGKRKVLFQRQGVIVQNSILGKYESPCKQIQNSWKFSQTEQPLSNRFWTFKKYPFTFLSKIIQVLPFACICLV